MSYGIILFVVWSRYTKILLPENQALSLKSTHFWQEIRTTFVSKMVCGLRWFLRDKHNKCWRLLGALNIFSPETL